MHCIFNSWNLKKKLIGYNKKFKKKPSTCSGHCDPPPGGVRDFINITFNETNLFIPVEQKISSTLNTEYSFNSFSMSCFIILYCLEVCSAYNTIATAHSVVSVIALAYARPAPSGVPVVSGVSVDVAAAAVDVSAAAVDVSAAELSPFSSVISASIVIAFIVQYSKNSYL